MEWKGREGKGREGKGSEGKGRGEGTGASARAGRGNGKRGGGREGKLLQALPPSSSFPLPAPARSLAPVSYPSPPIPSGEPATQTREDVNKE